FYLADKYRNPVVVLSDAMTGQTMEPLEVRPLKLGPLPDKDWTVRATAFNKDGERHSVYLGGSWGPWVTHLEDLERKYQTVAETDVRYEDYLTEDANFILIAFGYMGRFCKEAINIVRSQGFKAGLIRPITLWPFPRKVINQQAIKGCKFLVVEDNMGLMVDDVRLAVEGKAEVHLLNVSARHVPEDYGMILPERVAEEIRKFI
ncbi:transketolase C-terminal domain-containing protein, partial [Chloroflexota bacterium]